MLSLFNMNRRDWNRLNHDPTDQGLSLAQIGVGAVAGAMGAFTAGMFQTPQRSGSLRSGLQNRGRTEPGAPQKPPLSNKRPSIQDPTPNKKRNINHSSISPDTDTMVGVQFGPANRGNTDGDEVAVVPPPARIAKSYADYTTIVLPWFENIGFTTVTPSTALVTSVIRLNSVFDPSFTGGSAHQPMGRDAFIAFGYKYYRVLSAKVDMYWANISTLVTDSTTLNDSSMVGYSLSDDPALAFSDFRAFAEAKQTSYRIIRGSHPNWDGTQKVAYQSYTYTPESWDYHVQETGVEERWTPVGANPTNLHYLILNAGPSAHILGTLTECYVSIHYTVQFREVGHITAIDTTA